MFTNSISLNLPQESTLATVINFADNVVSKQEHIEENKIEENLLRIHSNMSSSSVSIQEYDSTINVNFRTVNTIIEATVARIDNVIDVVYELVFATLHKDVNIEQTWDCFVKYNDSDTIQKLINRHIEILLGGVSISEGTFEENGVENDATINVLIIEELRPIYNRIIHDRQNSSLNNYREWKKNIIGMPITSYIRRIDLIKYKIDDNFNNVIYEPGCPWYNYITIEPLHIYSDKLRQNPLQNYKEWKKNILEIPINDKYAFSRRDLHSYQEDDNFHTTIYEPGCPWYNYIHNNMIII